MPITAIISGLQTGADQGGLWAARHMKIRTGGYAPKGYLTEKGPMPQLGMQFGLVETDSPDYTERTELNVVASTGTVIFGRKSGGSELTQVLCAQYGRPCLWLKEFKTPNREYEFRLWVDRNHITTLNVAGNRESKSPGIRMDVERFLRNVVPFCK